MRVSCCFIISLALPLTTSAKCPHSHNRDDGSFQPPRISFQELQDMDPSSSSSESIDFLKSVFGSIGMISITDIPGFRNNEKPETMDSFSSCIKSVGGAEEVFPDGTIRTTMAASKQAPLFVEGTDYSTTSCDTFQQVHGAFRDTVSEVTHTVGHVLSNLLNNGGSLKPLLKDATGTETFDMDGIVTHGEHLEHFHSYSKKVNSADNNKVRTASTTAATIDWHTDQGLLLVFSPGLVDGKPSQNDFYVQLEDGSQAVVQFGVEDELVVLLGDGVNQYVNTNDNDNQSFKLRAVPHALVMAPSDSSRVWYGRMVLPPAQALHPVHQVTFEEIRRQMISGATNTDQKNDFHATLGCASFPETHRHLQDVTAAACNNNTDYYCWHRCMNYTTYPNVSHSDCAARNLQVGCINNQRQLWQGSHDPNFHLACIDLATIANATTPGSGSSQSSGTSGPTPTTIAATNGPTPATIPPTTTTNKTHAGSGAAMLGFSWSLVMAWIVASI